MVEHPLAGDIRPVIEDQANRPAVAVAGGGDRPWSYDFDFPATDRKLIALEHHELATCVRTKARP